MPSLNIFNQSYNPNTSDSVSQRCINYYMEETGDQDYPVKFLATPGYALYKDLSGSSIRGMFEHKGKGYIVKDNTVYEQLDDASKTSTALGTLTTSTGRVNIAAINDQLLFADGTKVWSYTLSTTTWAEVTDADLPASVSQIESHLGYFIAVEPNSDNFFVSDLNDGTSWSALSFAGAELNYDNISTTKALNQTLWVLGEVSLELWYNSGAATGAPYDRRSGGSRPIGCAAADTALVIDSNVYWLAQSESGLLGVVQANESGVNIISTRPMLEDFNSYNSISDAFAWTFSDNSHIFYAITFPDTETARGRTWAFDISTGKWCELESENPTLPLVEPYTRHIANAHMFLNRKHLIGDFSSGKIYEMSSDYYDEAGNTIRRQLVSSHLKADRKYIVLNNLEVGVESDTGTVSEDPDIILEVSKDNGNTWGSEQFRTAGTLGGHRKRAIWTRLGSGRAITLRLTMSDSVAWNVLWVRADVRDGRA